MCPTSTERLRGLPRIFLGSKCIISPNVKKIVGFGTLGQSIIARPRSNRLHIIILSSQSQYTPKC